MSPKVTEQGRPTHLPKAPPWPCFASTEKSSIGCLLPNGLNIRSPYMFSRLCQEYLPSTSLIASIYAAVLDIYGLLLEVPASSSKYGDGAFPISSSSIRNSLPPNVRHSKSMEQFKKHLKTYLFTQCEHGWALSAKAFCIHLEKGAI